MGLSEAVAGVLALHVAVRAAVSLLEAVDVTIGRIGLRGAYAAAETAPRACCAGLSGAARACPAAGLVMALAVALVAGRGAGRGGAGPTAAAGLVMALSVVTGLAMALAAVVACCRGSGRGADVSQAVLGFRAKPAAGLVADPSTALASLAAAGCGGGRGAGRGLPHGPAGRCVALWRVVSGCGPTGTSGWVYGRQRGCWAGIWAC